MSTSTYKKRHYFSCHKGERVVRTATGCGAPANFLASQHVSRAYSLRNAMIGLLFGVSGLLMSFGKGDCPVGCCALLCATRNPASGFSSGWCWHGGFNPAPRWVTDEGSPTSSRANRARLIKKSVRGRATPLRQEHRGCHRSAQFLVSGSYSLANSSS